MYVTLTTSNFLLSLVFTDMFQVYVLSLFSFVSEDPVSIHAPCCPDSLTKILLDLFADKDTATIFYTSDMMVLIDIITRQLHDLCPGEKVRFTERKREILGGGRQE